MSDGPQGDRDREWDAPSKPHNVERERSRGWMFLIVAVCAVLAIIAVAGWIL